MNRRAFLRLSAGGIGSVLGTAGIHRYSNDNSEIADPSSFGGESKFVGTESTDESPPTRSEEESTPETEVRHETRDGSILLGMSPKNISEERFSAIAEWQGQPSAVNVVFIDVGLSQRKIRRVVNEVLDQIWSHGRVPHLIWQPYMNPAGEASPTVAREIALGEHDQTLSNWAEALSGWLKPSEDTVDRRLYLNFAPEMNGDWVPWDASDGDTTSQDYVEMWQRVHGRLAEEDLDEDTVQWVWAVNNVGRASYSVSDFYPGDEYVDWTGVHGYNWYQWGEWTPVEVIFDSMIGQLRELSDNPIAISEYGCSAKVKDGYDTERKGEWIQKAADYFEENDVRMASWFNHLEETDWGVFGGEYGTETFEYNGKTYNAYSEYRDIAQRDSFISAHPTHPRGLTGDEFRGEL